MTVPEVSCKTVAMQNSLQWPCSMYPIPHPRLVRVRISYIFFLIFPEHPEFWAPLQIPIWGPPGCTLYQENTSSRIFLQSSKDEKGASPLCSHNILSASPTTVPITLSCYLHSPTLECVLFQDKTVSLLSSSLPEHLAEHTHGYVC